MTRKRVLVVLGLLAAVALLVGGFNAFLVARAAWYQSKAGMIPVDSLDQIAGSKEAGPAGIFPAPLVDGIPVVITITEDSISLATGCNTISGTARIQDSRLYTGSLAMTEIGCPPALQAQEKWLLDMLRSQPRLERGGPVLATHWGADEKYWMSFSSEWPTVYPKPSS